MISLSAKDSGDSPVTAARPQQPRPAKSPEKAGLVVVANRLPIQRSATDTTLVWQPSPGGLASALTPVLSDSGGVWIGWSGLEGDSEAPPEYEGIGLRTVSMSEAEYEQYYLGFGNATLWPLYHDAVRSPTFDRGWWHAYSEINAHYASMAATAAAPGGTVWVHDYQLQLVPRMLRELRPDVRIGFFLHIPFPPRELFLQLPWRREILDGLLGADLVGFQVSGAASNFARLARRVVGASGNDHLIEHDGRRIRVGAFPISVDSGQLSSRASDPTVRARSRQVRVDLGDPDIVLLGVDRLDYTKGIDHRIKAVAELFGDGTLSASKHVMVQIAVPSREVDPHYQRERQRLEQLVSETNGEYGRVGHPAIHYLYQSVPFDELVALYLAADVMLVTPLRDGMNLVSKEYAACRSDLTGRLVLSEFAGAATELRAALMVNPHDLDGIKETIRRAVWLDPKEERGRMRRLHRTVVRRDVHLWARTFLTALSECL